jgi:hypothetical protein
MRVVYVLYNGKDAVIPFYDYDKALFLALAARRLGYWDAALRVFRLGERINTGIAASVFSGRALVEAGPESFLKVSGFFEVRWERGQEPERIEAAPVRDAFPNDLLMRLLETELRARKYSPRTVKTYLHFVRDFFRFSANFPEEEVNAALKAYMARLESEGYAASSMNLAINAITFFYAHADRQGPCSINGVKRPKKDHRLPAVLDKGEVRKIIDGGQPQTSPAADAFVFGGPAGKRGGNAEDDGHRFWAKIDYGAAEQRPLYAACGRSRRPAARI